MSDGAEGLPNIGGIGYIAVGGEKDGTGTGGVGCVADVGIGGYGGTKDRSVGS